MITRRQFLIGASTTFVVACSGGSKKPASTSGTGTAASGDKNSNILVVVQLTGGNDALNTLVPLQGKYHDVRPTLGVADDQLVKLPGTDAFGLHPALDPMAPLFAANRVTTLAGIGFPQPNRSHFAALDMWWAASEQASKTGWLGRWLDSDPNTDRSLLSAVAFGSTGSVFSSEKSRITAVNDPRKFVLVPPKDVKAGSLGEAWAKMSPDYAAAKTTVDLFANLKDADPAEEADSDVTGGKTIASRLVTAARLIVTDPTVRVIHIAVGGFDTHANQAKRQDLLLRDLAVGLADFNSRMKASGNDGRVMVITTSEFGRRSYENASGGTDHGKAGALFIVSPNATGKLHGTLNLDDLDDGDIKPVIDTRSLYAVGLDWLGADTDTILGGKYERLL